MELFNVARETMPNAILGFRGRYYFLSNFSASPLEFEGKKYPTAEHAFQAAKAMDPTTKEAIRTARTPGDAKKLGRGCRIREDWESVKVDLMAQVLLAKFRDNNDLRQRLLDTGEAQLVEVNTWGDTFWGVVGEHGKNVLGQLLMHVRTQLREEASRIYSGPAKA